MKLLWAVMTLFACASNVIAAPYFHDTDLVDIPTGKSMEHGVFNVGTFIAFRNERALPRAELAVKLDFGLFNRLEIGIITIKYNDTSFLLSNFKFQLLKEVGEIPNVAIGVENVGDKVVGLADTRRYESASPYLVISKQFNLPVTHLITGHIGIGRKRYIDDDDESIGQYLHGIFGGISKDVQPRFINGNAVFSLELDGRGVNAGIRYSTHSGLLFDIAVEALNAPLSEDKEMRYLFGIAFTNRMMLQQIDETLRLAKQAGKRAGEALSQIEKEKQSSKK